MTIATLAKPKKVTPLLFEGLTWREFKAVEQLLDRPGYRLFFLDGILEIRQISGETHQTVTADCTRMRYTFVCIAAPLTVPLYKA
ncbi:hypothetical protein MiSe_14960 [Microseira wollei NIES-4236]|uniref:Restriction endonuclease domain-containing protein n=1 Tax=Microseira wollei NIES-4236 TaxID=2530354 RepID=A0AAV3WFM4_9CYAN|nr:hypothetical protein MiSe_14960 [Microseira wollei NIES-4236]